MEKFAIEEYTLAATAGNVATFSVAPADRKRLFLSLVITLITDATVANRNIRVILENAAGNDLDIGVLGHNIAASTTASLTITGYLGGAGITIPTGDYASWGAERLWLTPTIGLRISIDNGVAGDSYSARGIYKEQVL